MSIFKSNLAKVLTVATVVFAAQHLSQGDESAKSAQAQQAELHKASLSCQNWSKQGYGDLMKC